MTDFAREDLVSMIKDLMDRVIDRAPDSSLPPLVTKGYARSVVYKMADSMSTDDLLDIMVMAHLDLQKIFDHVTREWMLHRVEPSIKQKLEDAMIAFL